jgi:DNA-binding response OmpR family regulator
MMSPERILVIEDEPAQSEAFRQMLEYRGYAVRCAKDWAEATRVLSTFNADLVVVDLLLISSDEEPDDGFGIIRTLRSSIYSDIGILVWTSHFVNARDEIRALRVGADDYVRKDADFGLIEARIEALLRRLNRSTKLP